MISITKTKGFVDLLLILPLFLGICFVVMSAGIILYQKTKLEKTAWTIQIQKTYGIPETKRHSYKISNLRIDSPFTQASIQFAKLPIAFAGFLGLNPAKTQTLTWTDHFPEIVKNFYRAAFEYENLESPTQLNSDFHLNTGIVIPGSNFKGDWKLKFAMWQESMQNAGFGAHYPLYALGLPELAGIDVPANNFSANELTFMNKSQPDLENEVR